MDLFANMCYFENAKIDQLNILFRAFGKTIGPRLNHIDCSFSQIGPLQSTNKAMKIYP